MLRYARNDEDTQFAVIASRRRRNPGLAAVKQPAVYIMANRQNGTLYTGVTSNLMQRVYQHREGVISGFTSRYGCKLLVWFEMHETMESAISREKQIKGGSRTGKLMLIEASNPYWRDLYPELTDWIASPSARNDES